MNKNNVLDVLSSEKSVRGCWKSNTGSVKVLSQCFLNVFHPAFKAEVFYFSLFLQMSLYIVLSCCLHACASFFSNNIHTKIHCFLLHSSKRLLTLTDTQFCGSLLPISRLNWKETTIGVKLEEGAQADHTVSPVKTVGQRGRGGCRPTRRACEGSVHVRTRSFQTRTT